MCLQILVSLFACLLLPTICSAHAARGDDKFSILLCKSSDADTPPNGADYYKKMLTQIGQGGLADYWWDMSYGTYDMRRSDLHGWYTVAKTTTVWEAGATQGKIDACVAAAKSDPNDPYTVPPGNHVLVVGFPWVGDQATGPNALVPWQEILWGNEDISVGTVSHEAGHALGLPHSFSNDRGYINVWWARRGEYDNPWDSMSFANAFMVSTPFGMSAVGMAGPLLDDLGWIPRHRIKTVGADSVRSAVYTLAALGHPDAPGLLFLRIPVDIKDPNHYFTVEFRRKDRWDAGIPDNTILINEVYQDYGSHLTHIYRDLTDPNKPPLQFVAMQGLMIKMLSMDLHANTAQVQVISDFALQCQIGYVNRNIISSDDVCVLPDDLKTIQSENADDSQHKSPNGGAYGPDTCKQGYVWRDATIPAPSTDPTFNYDGDRVCVDGAARAREKANNDHNPQHAAAATWTHGPNGCKVGWVWREADDWDWVCVTSETRQRTLDENSQAASHRNPTGGPYGPDTCLSNYVWREAFPTDHVCVPFASRQAAIADNAARFSRWIDF